MPRKLSPFCPKCGQPRYVSARGGKLQPFCHEHMKEYWRDHNRGVNSKLRYSNSESASAPLSDAQPTRITHSQNGGGRCIMCHRTSQQAAIFALCAHVWCSTCTPEGAPYINLLNRLVPAAPIPMTEGNGLSTVTPTPANDEDTLRSQLQDALRELRVLREAVNAPLTAWEHYQ